jgi:hypothetical protein
MASYENDHGVQQVVKEPHQLESAGARLESEPRGKATPQSIVVAALPEKNPAALTAAHKVGANWPVVRPPVTATPAAGFRFDQDVLDVEIHELLLEVRKAQSVFWVGAAVPKGTTDFTRAQVFFHPTVVQARKVVAADTDYRDFKGGWSGSLQRYVAMQGGQLAGAGLKMPLLVPFTTMAALDTKHHPGQNMFTDRPVETLNAIMAAIQRQITQKAGAKPTLSALGAASFSSGISALRLFLAAMRSSGLVKEVIDFDSPHIKKEPKMLTRSPGAVSKCFTQTGPPPSVHPGPGYVILTAKHFDSVTAYTQYPEPQRTHARIGWMMYFQAMMTSALRSATP